VSARVRSPRRSSALTTTSAASWRSWPPAVLRFVAIGDQAFWRDEASTVIDVQGSFGHLWTRLVELEGTPPLYFVVAWAWAKVFGTSEAALRSLSALFGTATIPVAAALARRLAAMDRREVAALPARRAARAADRDGRPLHRAGAAAGGPGGAGGAHPARGRAGARAGLAVTAL
jgi:predicted membrane-bound mannosyltransferase